jgi:methylenetetrahydrofolate dehydrogenase (NAD+)
MRDLLASSESRNVTRPSRLEIPLYRPAFANTFPQFTRKSCESLGIEYELRQVGAARSSLGDQPNVSIGVEEAILEANEDDEVDGIMVYYPIHGGSQDQYLQQCVSPYKDVEGLNHKFLFNLYHK